MSSLPDKTSFYILLQKQGHFLRAQEMPKIWYQILLHKTFITEHELKKILCLTVISANHNQSLALEPVR